MMRRPDWTVPGPAALIAALLPALATALFVGTTYFWMIPRYHDIAIRDEPIHYLYLWHATLLLGGLIFFWCPRDPRPDPHGASFGARLFMIWFAAMGNILLGAFLTFKTVALYHAYAAMGRLWPIGSLADETSGGLTMRIPGCMKFATAALAMIHGRGRQEEKRFLYSPVPVVGAAELRRRAANRIMALSLLAFAGTALAIALATALACHYSAALLAS